jgi:hypothetical protein
MKSKEICYDVPVQATYRIIDGKPVMISSVRADIPADVIARLLCQLGGISPVEEKEVNP